MSEDSILMALEGMQRDIVELRKELRSTVERLTLVAGHEIRLARIEVDVESLKGKVDSTEKECLSRQRYVDMLDSGLPQTPEAWWDNKVAKLAGLVGWSLFLLLLPKILKTLGMM